MKDELNQNSSTNRLSEIHELESKITEDRFTLPDQAATLLYECANNKVKLSSLADDRNDDLAILIHSKLITFLPDETVVPTEKGLHALGKRIIYVYPFGVNGTIKDYNNTFLSMSANAVSAFISGWKNTSSTVMKKAPRQKIAALLNTWKDLGVFGKLDTSNLEVLYDHMASIILNKRSIAGKMSFLTNKHLEISEELKDLLFKRSKIHVEKGGSIKLETSVFFNEDLHITGISRSEDDQIEILSENRYTNTKTSLQIENLQASILGDIICSLEGFELK